MYGAKVSMHLHKCEWFSVLLYCLLYVKNIRLRMLTSLAFASTLQVRIRLNIIIYNNIFKFSL